MTQTPVDLIVTNGKVLTMDAANPLAEAVAIKDGKIVALGNRREIEAHSAAKIIDAGGRSVLPGFVESHLHLVMGGAELAHLQLGDVHGFDALANAFRRFGAAHPDKDLLIAQGASYGMLDHPVTRHDLDRVIADRPIAMTAPDHHTIWANTAALKAAGILHGAVMPHGHEVVMGDDGLATGELREFEAFAPVIALGGETRLNLGIATGGEPKPWPTAAEQAIDRAKALNGLRHAARHGITSMVNMDGNLYTLELLNGLRAEGNLLARVRVPFHFKPHMDLSELSRAVDMHARYNDDWLSSNFVKMFMDGVVDSRTAFMLRDYVGYPGHRSEPLFDPARFKQICTEIDRLGMQIAVHCIGDGAVRTTIDGYEAALLANGRKDARHRIEHIEFIDQSDIPRLAKLGIVASLQPPHPPGAMDFPIEPTMSLVDKSVWKGAYLWKSLADQGAKIAYSSDWPVVDISVMRGIQAALTRQPYDGCADERLSRMETLYAYTAGGAWAGHSDHVTGTLRAGLAGDVVIVDGDLETIAAQDIGKAGIYTTIAGGRITHQGDAA